MFSNNQKISIRQTRRLLILDLFGISSLLLPGILADVAGTDGIFCIAAGSLLAVLYLYLLGRILGQMKGSFYSYLKQQTGSVGGDIIMIFYLFFFLLLAAFVLYHLTGIIRAWLLPEGSYMGICFLLLLLAAYASMRGIEGRVRIYEILFWFLGIPLLLMLALAARDVNPDYWTPIVHTAPGDFLWGTLCVFAFFLPLSFLLFLKPSCNTPEKLLRCAKRTVLVVSGINGLIYLILLGIFQVKATQALERPVITLMSMVKLPGGFFARLDAFMTAVWFVSLFALMNTGVFYAGHILKELFHEKETHYGLGVALVLVFAAVRWFFSYPGAGELYASYIGKIGMPVLVVIPLFLWISGSIRSRKKQERSGKGNGKGEKGNGKKG